MKQLSLCLLLLATVFTACKKENSPANPTENTPGADGGLKEPGYGPSTAPFIAPDWKLPNGVELVDSLHDINFCFYMSTPARFEEYKNFRGLPGGVGQLCGTLRNKTNTPITIVFPETLVVRSSHEMSQGLLLLFVESITIPANSEKTIMIGGFCINQSRHAPEPYDETGKLLSYSFGPSVIPPALNEIRDILKPKNLSYQSVLKANGTIDIEKFTRLSVIQAAVWQVTDEGGLTQATRQKLKDLVL